MIRFDASLSSQEITTLNTLISTHVPDNSPPKHTFYNYIPRNNSVSSTSYQRLGGTFKYGGSDNVGTINYIEVISYKDEGPTSYSIRIFDRTNDLMMVEKTGLTNVTDQINSLGTITNIPTSNAILEVQAKRIGGSGNSKNIYVEEVIIYHDN